MTIDTNQLFLAADALLSAAPFLCAAWMLPTQKLHRSVLFPAAALTFGCGLAPAFWPYIEGVRQPLIETLWSLSSACAFVGWFGLLALSASFSGKGLARESGIAFLLFGGFSLAFFLAILAEAKGGYGWFPPGAHGLAPNDTLDLRARFLAAVVATIAACSQIVTAQALFERFWARLSLYFAGFVTYGSGLTVALWYGGASNGCLGLSFSPYWLRVPFDFFMFGTQISTITFFISRRLLAQQSQGWMLKVLQILPALVVLVLFFYFWITTIIPHGFGD